MLLLRSVVIIAFMLLTIIEGGFNERLRDTFTLTSPLKATSVFVMCASLCVQVVLWLYEGDVVWQRGIAFGLTLMFIVHFFTSLYISFKRGRINCPASEA